MSDELEKLEEQKAEIETKIAELRRASACPVCDGPGVLRARQGGFIKCFCCTNPGTRRMITLKSGRQMVWSPEGVGLLRVSRESGWGGRLQQAWLKEDPMYLILTELLESVP